MMAKKKVTTSQISYAELVRRADPTTTKSHPPIVYHFGGRRVFVDSNKGPYA